MKANLEAEQALLGSICLNSDIYLEVAETVSFDDFYSPQHRAIFSAMGRIQELGDPIEFVTLISLLSQENLLDTVGGKDYLASLSDCVITSTAWRTYAKEVLTAKFNDSLFLLSQSIQDHIAKSTDPRAITSEIMDFLASNNGFRPKENPLSVDIRDFVDDSLGTFLSSEVVKSLQLSSKNEKKNVSKILGRLVDEGIIERTGTRNAQWRRIENQSEEIDFINTSTQDLDLVLPLGVHRWVRIYPKQLIVYAGSPDAGKTALMLNLVKLNQNTFPTTYMSSEMGGQELRVRLDKFEDTPLDSWNFRAIERSTNFADVIEPNGLNVIDFLEIGDNFYQVGQMLTDIFVKLRNGIAVIALQKDPKKDIGKGGWMSLEKPRLYLTVDNDNPGHLLTIKKAKNWRDSMMNPNGMSLKFKIVNGCKLVQEGTWGM